MMAKAGIPKLFYLLVLFLGLGVSAGSQTIQYSRQTLKLPSYDDIPTYDRIRLVSGVGGKHHLLLFKRGAPAYVLLYDRDLQAIGIKELPVKYATNVDTRIIPFKSFYYLYFHKPGSPSHELWKVTADGEALSMSHLFQHLIDSTFKRKLTTLELVNKDGQLAVISNTYYKDLKVLACTVLRVDEMFTPLSSSAVSIPFERGPELLNGVTLIGNQLFILKSKRSEGDYALELLKGDLGSGKLFRKAFTSSDNFTQEAAFTYSTADSSILVQSLAGARVFICRVDLSLNEVVPPTLVAPRFSSTIFTNFILLNGGVQQWLEMTLFNNRLRSRTGSDGYAGGVTTYTGTPYRNSNTRSTFDYELQNYSRSSMGSDYYISPYEYDNRYANRTVSAYYTNPPIRFSVVDTAFRLLSDSVVTNKKEPEIQTLGRYVNVTVGTKSYLILKQDFPRKRKGLLLLGADSTNHVTSRDISVYEKYDYLLQYAQVVNGGTVVMPYVQKSDVGLVKLSFEKEEL
jgi:hypothetical protein